MANVASWCNTVPHHSQITNHYLKVGVQKCLICQSDIQSSTEKKINTMKKENEAKQKRKTNQMGDT